MIKKEEKIKKVTVQTLYCDDCGVNIGNNDVYVSSVICEICGKDLCEKCVGHEDSTFYRECYCNNCWTLGEEFRFKKDALENEIELLETEYRNKCKTQKDGK